MGRIIATAFIVLGLSLGSAALAETPPASQPGGGPRADRKGPLATMPSEPGPHIAKIKALGENAWLNIGTPAADPQWGKAPGRSWAAHMPYAAELGVAFLAGEGVHGWSKPDGHYSDDFWAYDMNGHRWICLYPGADIKNLSLTMSADGFEVDKDGQPIPVAQLGHAFEQVTYDTDRKKFMFMPCAVGNFKPVLKDRLESIGGGYPWPYTPVNCSPWMYDPATGKFELLKTKGPFPAGHTEAVVASYVPSMKKLFHWRGGKDVWFYDIEANSWKTITPKGPKPPFGNDPGACLDLKRDRIYMGGGYYPLTPGPNALWGYDLKTDEWVDLAPKGKPAGGCKRYGPNHAVMNYDAAADVMLLFYYRLPAVGSQDGDFSPGAEALGVYAYDPAANSWSEKLAMPKELVGACINSFYSAELNAHFFYVSGDSAAVGPVWVYRYKKAAGETK